MPKNKLLLEKIIAPTAESGDDDDDDYGGINNFNDEYSDDSDAELAKDFAMGKLKPGLYGMLPFKRTAEQINDKEGKLQIID